MSQPQYIVVRPGPNHILHLLLSVLTLGLWVPVWFLISLRHRLREWDERTAAKIHAYADRKDAERAARKAERNARNRN